MENNFDKNKSHNQEDIDIIKYLILLWKKKQYIVKVTIIFAFLGFFIAITSPKEFSAGCVVVPETKGGVFSSSLGGLAAIAGINLGAESGDMLSPLLYDKLLMNINLRKELVNSYINIERVDEPITILDYYTNDAYSDQSLLSLIKKYTIGLPGIIYEFLIDKFKKTEDSNTNSIVEISSYTKDELKCLKKFSRHYSVVADKKNGDVTIVANMPEPIAAAQVAERVKDLLQKYVVELKLQKAEINYNYIKQRYDEAKLVFESKQVEYAKFQDANKVLSTALSRAKEEQMRSEFNVAKDLFNQLTTQLVQAEMKIKEDIPILTVVEPVQVPLEKSKPKKIQILFIWIVMGVLIGCGTVIGVEWLKILGVDNKWIRI